MLSRWVESHRFFDKVDALVRLACLDVLAGESFHRVGRLVRHAEVEIEIDETLVKERLLAAIRDDLLKDPDGEGWIFRRSADAGCLIAKLGNLGGLAVGDIEIQ